MTKTIIVAGVSCSGKSTLIDEIRFSAGLQTILGLSHPIRITSKYELEQSLELSEDAEDGSTLLHVEINPDPVRERRVKWIKFAQASKSVSLVLVKPSRADLLLQVRARARIAGDTRIYRQKSRLYSNKWLSAQYLRFFERVSGLVPLDYSYLYREGTFEVLSQDSGLAELLRESRFSPRANNQ